MSNLLPSILTLGNLTAGFVALSLATGGLFVEAAVLVALAAGLDLADGALARFCSVEGEFGANLDSLADVVSFGAAPALALYLSTLQEGMPYVGLAVSAGFLACGAARLARFPLVKREDCYLGLPIPPAGLALALLAAAGPPPVLALAASLALGALMVSRVPFPSLAALKAFRRAVGRDRVPKAKEPLRDAGGSR
ncbi:CDP-diacylglycerol--serine O-phosphatidyltransferase [Rubrobacter marinus]|uniref:CDP-diacylglycerol--serine O-phosphatidyltransferase n=1 Tax=Rubrobacter marinus TaxID=2653852 RepID=UPI00140C404D|nr:CDP-diacylglycerol--serine O-phosphatidyltransferase [Rubrobacter marinus]